MRIIFSLSIFLFTGIFAVLGQTTTMVILNDQEIIKLRKIISENDQAKAMADSIVGLTDQALERTPRPLEVVYFEGLLETNPKRIDTKISFLDIDATLNLIYASYIRVVFHSKKTNTNNTLVLLQNKKQKLISCIFLIK